MYKYVITLSLGFVCGAAYADDSIWDFFAIEYEKAKSPDFDQYNFDQAWTGSCVFSDKKNQSLSSILVLNHIDFVGGNTAYYGTAAYKTGNYSERQLISGYDRFLSKWGSALGSLESDRNTNSLLTFNRRHGGYSATKHHFRFNKHANRWIAKGTCDDTSDCPSPYEGDDSRFDNAESIYICMFSTKLDPTYSGEHPGENVTIYPLF